MIKLSWRGRVAEVTLQQPSVNAINHELIDLLQRVSNPLATRDDWTVLRAYGTQKVFAAGADLELIAPDRHSVKATVAA